MIQPCQKRASLGCRLTKDHRASLSEADSPNIDPGTFSRAATPASADGSTRSCKIVHLDASSASTKKPEVMKCLLPPHQPLSFSSYEEYDVHYQKYHVNRCQECHKNFPDEHYLGLHIAENHDPLNEALRARGEKTYACFIPTCDRLCSTPQKRRLHVIDKHQFPKYYDFFIVNDGIDKRNSMLRSGPGHRRRSSAANSAVSARQRAAPNANGVEKTSGTAEEKGYDEEGEESMEVDRIATLTVKEETAPSSNDGEKGNRKAIESPTTVPEAEMDDITSAMSALKFVPPSVRFGRGRGRGRGGLARS
ncbi:hypothetical protein K432DRAFT_382412 [Lepidopterella palustris CBS 459.81]|uniref:C2H2-type domain-containing protein n=1 Tax=Lepidopterella palustris CBS 459.81 TaxID=1314670 RepID=A0A8E2EAC0_9PEZI|nr:hypothetical protein K432DRAFT_382412 [Lepidopterella palustris CBS 459.81]